MRLSVVAGLFLCISGAFGVEKTEAVKRIDASAKVFREIMATSDNAIPRDLLERAKCVAIIPGAKRAGFIIGGQYGKGVMTCRTTGMRGWTGVSTVRIEGGSIGAQIGAGETDIILVVMNDKGAQRLMKSEFTIGGDVAAMAGPVGRSSTAQTDAFMRAEILSYSRSRGAFAGVTLTGSTLRADQEDNTSIYGKEVRHEDVLMGKIPATAAATPLYRLLNRYSGATRK